MTRPSNPDRFQQLGLAEPDAAAISGMSLAAFRRLVKAGMLPQPLDLDVRPPVWSRQDLEDAFKRLSKSRSRLADDINALDRELDCYET
jgi:predicted DNA-binding transcriptional regulator AlpA